MNIPKFLLAVAVTLIFTRLSAQCPTNAADFANGGDFTGPCTLDLGPSSVTIASPNVVNWNGGQLNIIGAPGSLTVQNGATFNVLSGNVVANDLSSGALTVNGTMNIAEGASYNSYLTITVNGALTVSGSVQADASRLVINSGGSVNIDGGTVTTMGTGNNEVIGSLILQGDGALITNGDLEISGTVNVKDNATMDVGDDLFVFNGGSLTIEENAVVNVDDDVSNMSDDSGPAGGSIIVNGTLNVGSEVLFIDTHPPHESSLTGEGQITAQDDFADGECADYPDGMYAFCDCPGNGVTCNGALPILLTNFSAHQNSNAILLEWETATETNNHFFTVERLLGNDAFESILTVEGSGTTMITKSYQAVDAHPHEGKNYYRLRQTDFDGKNTTSEVIMAEFKRKEVLFDVHPNPTRNNKFHINIKGLQPAQELPMTLYTSQGIRVFQAQHKADFSGNIHQEVEVVAKGFYIFDVAGKSIKILVE